jgi:hypothetical protein
MRKRLAVVSYEENTVHMHKRLVVDFLDAQGLAKSSIALIFGKAAFNTAARSCVLKSFRAPVMLPVRVAPRTLLQLCSRPFPVFVCIHNIYIYLFL